MSLEDIIKPKPTYKEIKVGKYDMLVSKTDFNGVITYANKNFVKTSGYKLSELIGAPHNIIRHPDMPKAIFFMMFDRLQKGRNFLSVLKNMTSKGDHYWVTTDFAIHKNREGGIVSFTAFRERPSRQVINEIEPLYKKMVEIENESGMEASLEYLYGFLDEKKMSYDEYIKDLATPKGFGAMLLSKIFYK